MPPFDTLQRDRIVEVAGIDRVDRYDHSVGEIASTGGHRLVETLGLRPGIVDHLFGKWSGKRELMDHGLRIDADVTRLSEPKDSFFFIRVLPAQRIHLRGGVTPLLLF